MRTLPLISFAFLLFISSGSPARGQSGNNAQLTVEAIVQRAYATESAIIQRMRDLRPIVETYIQDLTPDAQLGEIPLLDTYFLGRFDWDNGPKIEFLVDDDQKRNVLESPVDYLPDGFASMAAPDWAALEPSRYDFTFVRREFLGEARTFVFDVTPRKGPNDGFSGRIWIEDREFHIVRYNGINPKTRRATGAWLRPLTAMPWNWLDRPVTFHIDGWRVNIRPGVWVPGHVYSEETNKSEPVTNDAPNFKSQTRFWGYAPEVTDLNEQFTAIEILEPSVEDSAARPSQLAPVQSLRRWEEDAAINVLEHLERERLLSPAGAVEDVLNTVINNLLVTNNITLVQPVKTRVLLTSPLESFTLGRTIVMSRGLIDVLPNEASLAMMLAHELSHILLGHQLIDTQFAFSDRLMISDAKMLLDLGLNRSEAEELAADAAAIEMLDRSPYADQLPDAGLFLRLLAVRGANLLNLVLPHFGDIITDSNQELRLAELMLRSPELVPEDLAQIPALPLGARLYLDPWNSRLELLQTASIPPSALREKVPLRVAPLTPFITYVEKLATSAEKMATSVEKTKAGG